MEDHIYHSTAPIEFKDVLVATGNLILDIAKQKTADELRAIFRKI